MRILLVAACAIACGQSPRRPMMTTSSPLAAAAVAGVTDPALREIVADHWEHLMRWAPTWATTLGDHRYDEQLAPRDAISIAGAAGERDELLARLRALPAGGLGDTDRITLALLRGQLEAQHAMDACKFHEWSVDSANASEFGELSYLVELHTVKSPRDAANLVTRMTQGDRLIDDTIANLKLGLAHGRVAAAEKLRRAIEQLDHELARPVETWAMAAPASATPPSPDPWPAGERERQVHALRDVVARQIRPAFVRLRDFLRSQVMPRARGEQEGLVGIPGGDACYRAAIFLHVGLAKAADELHALGLAEIARTDRELAELGKAVLGTDDLAATIARLRDDRALYFGSRDELLAAAQRALDRAKAAIPRFFSVLPRTDCVMRETPAYEAPYSTIAYYRQPHYDGTKPGEYFVNTYKPETRPRFELEALTWHESIPGHHLQIALAQELGELPMFRKLEGSTAFVEGCDAWRASRLVVDTGIHAMGWTRAQAEVFMREHTALTDVNISNEVDRYIGWPGQALAYKVGQLEIFKLRAEAQAALGDRFDLKAFHAVVLGAGAVTLPILDGRVRAWIAAPVAAR
ncbi:MAG: DUF885 domain-containing protein [Deltaproteobacteria bacterium]|nr:MAG: DUF885 domain-containing protein [Deltaproteobacteria bacterium]